MSYSTPSEEQIIRGVEIIGQLTHEWIDGKAGEQADPQARRQTAAGAETEPKGQA